MGATRLTVDSQFILKENGFVTYDWDITADYISWSENAHEILNLDPNQNISTGRGFTAILAPDATVSRIETAIERAQLCTGSGVPFEIEYPLISKYLDSQGKEANFWVEDIGRVYTNGSNTAIRLVGTMRVINERHTRQTELAQILYHDPQTNLLTRNRFLTLLDEDYARASKEGVSGALALVGIRRMHLINEMYGVDIGDEIVKEVGKRLESVLRINDSIARFGNSRIGILLRDCTESELLIACERFKNALDDEVIHTKAGPVSLSVDIGSVAFPSAAQGTNDIVGAASHALQDAQRETLSALEIYKPSPNQQTERREYSQTAQKVVQALSEERMQLAFQPIVSTQNFTTAFHEALIRMIDENGNLVAAGSFVNIASQLGLIRMVDHCAMKLAVEALNTYPEAVLSLNVTNETALDPSWISNLANAIDANPNIAPRLIVEITESHVAENLDESIRFVSTIQDLGCRVAVDDFGAGFTSFSNLKHLAVDIIKIDGMYVDDLVNSQENQIFIKSLLDISKSISSEVVVEWVQDEETAQLLKTWGVDYLQGTIFSAPLIVPPWTKTNPKAQTEFAPDLKNDPSEQLTPSGT